MSRSLNLLPSAKAESICSRVPQPPSPALDRTSINDGNRETPTIRTHRERIRLHPPLRQYHRAVESYSPAHTSPQSEPRIQHPHAARPHLARARTRPPSTPAYPSSSLSDFHILHLHLYPDGDGEASSEAKPKRAEAHVGPQRRDRARALRARPPREARQGRCPRARPARPTRTCGTFALGAGGGDDALARRERVRAVRGRGRVVHVPAVADRSGARWVLRVSVSLGRGAYRHGAGNSGWGGSVR